MLELKLMHGGLRSGAYDQGEREEERRFSPRLNARSTWTEIDEEAGEETLIAGNGSAEEKTTMAWSGPSSYGQAVAQEDDGRRSGASR